MLFVGDGMGIASLTAARMHKGTRQGISPPTAATLRMDEAPRACLVRTASRDSSVTDSAASMTSMVTGVKVANGVLSLDDASRPLRTLLEEAEALGLSTGIVTTTTVTHATPAALYAHVANRRDEEAIAAMLVPGGANPALGDGVEVLFGGGRELFLPAGAGGVRGDGRDLIADLRGAGWQYVRNADEMRRAGASGAGRILGLFADSHMAFEADRGATAEPSLAEMTRLAIEVLSRNPRGYFLMVEGGRIDHAHHYNNGRRAVVDVLAFDDALAAALDETTERDVVFVTADHDHTMVIAGYPAIDGGVFTQAGTDVHGVPYTAILYANGPAALRAPPPVLAEEQLTDIDFQERAGVPLDADTHGGMDVALFAFGPEAQFRDLPASIDNTDIYRRLLRVLQTLN